MAVEAAAMLRQWMRSNAIRWPPSPMLVAFHNKDGEEIRLLADQRNKQPSGISAIANRSGNWFYSGV